jgi:hypothetical protein
MLTLVEQASFLLRKHHWHATLKSSCPVAFRKRLRLYVMKLSAIFRVRLTLGIVVVGEVAWEDD